MYCDGGGLNLQVRGGAKSWIFRYTFDGHPRAMGLGSLDTIGLDEARERARHHRQQVFDGVDPLNARDNARLERRLAKAKDRTFRKVAEEWMEKNRPTLSKLGAENIERRFRLHIFPRIGDMPVQRFDSKASNAVQLIYDLLTPIWQTKPTVAKEAQFNISSVLGFAAANQYIDNGNAAAFDGPLSLLLPAHKTFHVVKHHAELPFDQVAQFMADLRAKPRYRQGGSGRQSPARDAFEFTILTATRKSQGRLAKWSELDREKGIWVCTEHKTKHKTGEDYVAPLSRQSLEVLTRMEELQKSEGMWGKTEYVFPSPLHEGHMSIVAANVFLHNTMGRRDITVHGFRTTFGQWAAEHGHDENDSELILGHVVGNTVRNIYKRNVQRIEPKRILMQQWADYCDRTEALDSDVIPFRHKASNGNGSK